MLFKKKFSDENFIQNTFYLHVKISKLNPSKLMDVTYRTYFDTEKYRTVRTLRTSCLRLLRSTYHGSHRLTRDAWFLYVWPDFLNTSLTRYFK